MSGPYHLDPEDLSITVMGDDGTPTRPDLSKMMFTRGSLPGPSNSGPPVATPPQMGNGHQNFNMGSVPHPSKSGFTPTRRDNQHQMMGSDSTPTRWNNQYPMMGSDCTPPPRYNQHQMMGSNSAPTRQYNRYQTMGSDSTPTRRDNQRQMMVDRFALLNSGMPAINLTRQDSSPQMLPTGLLPSPSFFGASVHRAPTHLSLLLELGKEFPIEV